MSKYYARIGSIKKEQVNYPANESFLMPHLFVLPKVIEAVKHTKNTVLPDLLGVRQAVWDNNAFLEGGKAA